MKNITQTATNRFSQLFYCLIITLITSLSGYSQNVGINTTGAAPNASAGLDVDFPDKGLLVPRVALTGTANAAPLSAHVAGMMVYNTATAGDVVPGFYYNSGTNWITGFPAGNSIGDMLYWNGSAWTRIPVGSTGQYLTLGPTNIPYWAAGSTFATLTTNAISTFTATTATAGGNITADNGAAILSRGVCYGTAASPTTANSIVVASPATGIGAFTCNLSALTRATLYYVRAYATNNAVTTYGDQQTFTTLPLAPTVAATTAATGLTSTTVITGGNVTDNGGATISERGICYGLTSTPTTVAPNIKVIDGTPGVGSFVSNITGLTPNTLYYVRSYAINSVGTTYGTQISFYALPVVTTTAITNITPTTATSGGNITSTGTVTARGVCWSTSTGPTVALTTKTNDGTTSGTFTSNITGLAAGTLYYVRAYATNGSGTLYGPELTFTTSFITTASICTVTPTSAVCGGTITTVTGLNITERGVVWNTSPAPTTANSKLTDPSGGTGNFVSNLTGLTNGITYYIRAYAINNGTTVYANNELSFTTGTPKVIGDALAGGKIIYVDCSGQHGLIGALVDQGSSVTWGCYGTLLNIGIAQGGGAIYAGLNNTNVIVANCGAGTAAQLCAAYTAGGTNLPGITNWYLPSHDELQILCDQRAVVNLTVSPSYAGSGVLYWSSTEYNSAIGYCHYSLGGIYDYNIYKNSTYYSSTSNLTYVRAVRAF